ncbi:MAG: putative Actinobacterial Holin-X, holin superfamily [Chthoniobacter sp.]|jgi:uncharacterized membrane protein YqjE|nr:putative Actinobacterial Holin-X, holin superfamily [Chthoniobacter sp.]
MADAAGPSQPKAGFFEHAREIIAALSAYLHARLRLAGIETKEALVHYAIILALIFGALFVAVFGYLFLCIGLMLVLAHFLHVFAGWLVLGFALVHILAVLVCGCIVKTRLAAPMFSATIDEFKKDSQWLSTSKQN